MIVVIGLSQILREGDFDVSVRADWGLGESEVRAQVVLVEPSEEGGSGLWVGDSGEEFDATGSDSVELPGASRPPLADDRDIGG